MNSWDVSRAHRDGTRPQDWHRICYIEMPDARSRPMSGRCGVSEFEDLEFPALGPRIPQSLDRHPITGTRDLFGEVIGCGRDFDGYGSSS